MLGVLDEVDKAGVIAYVYSLQVSSGSSRSAGFVGSGYLGFPFCVHDECGCTHTAASDEVTPANHAIGLLEVYILLLICLVAIGIHLKYLGAFSNDIYCSDCIAHTWR